MAVYGLGLGVVGEIRDRQPNLALKINWNTKPEPLFFSPYNDKPLLAAVNRQ
jgi:hypothetical protein